jgi:hypothetical protein
VKPFVFVYRKNDRSRISLRYFILVSSFTVCMVASLSIDDEYKVIKFFLNNLQH